MLRPLKVQTELARVIIQDGVFHGMGNDQELDSKNADQSQNQADTPESHRFANKNPPGMVINSLTIGVCSVSSSRGHGDEVWHITAIRAIASM